MTGTEYTNEVLDGMDVLGKDVLACSVSWAGENVKSESLEEAWQEVKRKQIADGSEQDRASAAAWPFSGLEERFGLSNVDVRKRIEGMRGSADCFMYRFLNEKAEGEGGATKSPAKTPAVSACLYTFSLHVDSVRPKSSISLH